MKISSLAPETLASIKHLTDKIGDIDLPDPTGWYVMVLQYVRPDKIGSLIMPEKAKQEDVYQGRVGVVLAVGPDAYADKNRFMSGPWCKPGDCVLWPPVEAAAARLSYGEGVTIAFLNDDRVLATGMDPVRATTNG